MAMSKKVYIEAAAVIKDAANRGGSEARATAYTIASELSGMFKRDNGAFDRNRFMDACGFGDPNGN